MNRDYILTSDGELYHYGVKGMKWGVVKQVANVATQGYKKISEHGTNTYNKKVSKYEDKAMRARKDKHKIRSMYYKHKAQKYRDKGFDEVSSFYEGLKDLSLKAGSIVTAAKIGKAQLERYMEDRRFKKLTKSPYLENNIRKWY